MNISFFDSIQEYFGESSTEPAQYSSLALAYIGDGVFDLIIRTIILDLGNGKVKDFHRMASNIVKAPSQARIIRSVFDELTEEEMAVYKRGRNAKSATSAKNSSITDYRIATGFEALTGYLYLENRLNRALEIIKLGMERAGFMPLHKYGQPPKKSIDKNIKNMK
ncbi:MAG: ribonuclease III [Lachnospiraceae bacterium]|nr:ribonuclease III [Lachnospiraceae bacterium]